MRRRDDRFTELVQRQLDLLAHDEPELLAEIDTAEEDWNRSGREHAEEAYGDYQLAVDALSDRLLELRDAYAATLDETTAEAYRAAVREAAARRFRRHPTVAADLSADYLRSWDSLARIPTRPSRLRRSPEAVRFAAGRRRLISGL